MTEGFRTLVVGVLAVGAGFTWQAIRTAAIPVHSPERLIAELRLAQIAALLLVLFAAPYVGMAVIFDTQPGVGFDIALAIGFFVVAAVTLVHEPRQALTILAFAFARGKADPKAFVVTNNVFHTGLEQRFRTVIGGAKILVKLGFEFVRNLAGFYGTLRRQGR